MKAITVTLLITVLLAAPILAQAPEQVASQTIELRLIAVATVSQAQELETRIRAGESFEALAREFSADLSAEDGGYVGEFDLLELRPEYRAVLGGLVPGEVTPIARVNSEYVLLQVVAVSDDAGATTDALWVRLTNQALEAAESGDKILAQELFESAVRETVSFSDNDYRVGASLTNLALFYHTEGRYEAAEQLYLRALGISEQALGANEVGIANTLENLAELYQTIGAPDLAEPLYLRAFEILEQAFGGDQPEVAQTLYSLGLLNHAQGNYSRAAEFYSRTLTIQESAIGAGIPEVREILFNQALLEQARENFSESEELYQRTISTYETTFGSDDNNLIIILENFASLIDEMGRPNEASRIRDRARTIEETLTTPQ